MGWIFIAYFLTILVFAGFYLALNRAGGYFSHESKDGGGGGAALALSNSYVREGKFYRQITVGDGAIDQSYCGMDINNNMEGELNFSMLLFVSIFFHLHRTCFSYSTILQPFHNGNNRLRSLRLLFWRLLGTLHSSPTSSILGTHLLFPCNWLTFPTNVTWPETK